MLLNNKIELYAMLHAMTYLMATYFNGLKVEIHFEIVQRRIRVTLKISTDHEQGTKSKAKIPMN